MSLRTPASVIGGIGSILLMFAFVGVISACAITIGIWPGEVKLLAPFFCTDAQPDPFVVADTYSPRPGETVTNFSLYCMGPRGDATDHGFMKPFLMISAIHGLIVMVPLVVFTSIGHVTATKASPVPTSDPSAFDPARGDDDADDDDSDRRDPPRRSPAPPGSTAGPFVD